MASKYNQYCQMQRLHLAIRMLEDGRPLDFVKKIAGVTTVFLLRHHVVYEEVILDPMGYDENGRHNGHMMKTGRILPTCGEKPFYPSRKKGPPYVKKEKEHAA